MADSSPTPAPSKMKKAGSRSQKGGASPGGGSPQPGNQRRRQSMLILDLQSKKKALLKQILDCRTELVSLDRSEMAVIERASNAGASDGDRSDRAGLVAVREPSPAPPSRARAHRRGGWRWSARTRGARPAHVAVARAAARAAPHASPLSHGSSFFDVIPT